MDDLKQKVFKESLRYLRVKYEHEDIELEAKIYECIDELEKLNSFKFLVKSFDKQIDDEKVVIDGVVIESVDIHKLLDNSKVVFAFACDFRLFFQFVLKDEL